MELNADLVADALLEEAVVDMARSLQDMQEEEEAHDEALAMQDAPSLETMLQRLQHMEVLVACEPFAAHLMHCEFNSIYNS